MLTFRNDSLDPFYNQAFEEFVFRTFFKDDIFFLWQNRPAVVVGAYQNICREVHIQTLRKLGIPVVRRMSGGGTVYHDLGNVNYTYISRQDAPSDYDRFLTPIIKALNTIGVPAPKSRTCDIVIGEQKVSGSAQRIAGGRLLHHGTLLFQSDLAALEQITIHHKNDCFQSRGTVSAICPVTNIRDHLTSPMTLEEFKARLLEQMVVPGSPPLTLDAEQEAEVCRLRDKKYGSWEWTWGKTPFFIYKKTGTFSGVPIQVTYQAKRGIVSGAVIDCAAVDTAEASRLLNGSRLSPETFDTICRTLVGNRAEDLMDWLL